MRRIWINAAENAPSSGNDLLMAVLAYFGPLALIPYLTDQSSDIKWHARQGLTLTGTWILVSICSGLFASVPLFGWIFILIMPFVSPSRLVLTQDAMAEIGDRIRQEDQPTEALNTLFRG